jgi:hypothetical protein
MVDGHGFRIARIEAIGFESLPLWPRQLISLADMIEFFAAGLAHNWQWLKAERGHFYQKVTESATGKPTPNEIHNLNALLKTPRLACRHERACLD